MPTLFTRIIDGDIPGTFVWSDDLCVGFMSIAPLSPGHTLIVPRREVENWLDLTSEELTHVTGVSQTVGRAIQSAFDPVKVGMMIAGLEVPHVHIHVVAIKTEADLDFANADTSAALEDIANAADRIRQQLVAMGRSEVFG
ncbi:MAG: HIT family protein [Acidimicrobiia bacterium]|nr:HIT family protein [Acidimicrobiia bacterium]